jgi:hypothetical protein
MGVLIDTEDAEMKYTAVLSFLNYLASGVVKWKHSPQQTKTFRSTHSIMRCYSNYFPYHKENVFLIQFMFPLYGVELMTVPLSEKKIHDFTLKTLKHRLHVPNIWKLSSQLTENSQEDSYKYGNILRWILSNMQ